MIRRKSTQSYVTRDQLAAKLPKTNLERGKYHVIYQLWRNQAKWKPVARHVCAVMSPCMSVHVCPVALRFSSYRLYISA